MFLLRIVLLFNLFVGNKFTDRVAKEFATSLKSNATLKQLDLSYNEFSEQGGLYLGAGLVRSTVKDDKKREQVEGL